VVAVAVGGVERDEDVGDQPPAVFTLVAWAFAHTFVVLQAWQPGSFTAANLPTADRSWTELLFLSVTTLSCTGSPTSCRSGARPQRRHARADGGPVLHRDGGHTPDRDARRPRRGRAEIDR